MLPQIVELAECCVSLVFVRWGKGKLVGDESFVVFGRAGERGGACVTPRCGRMIAQLILVKSTERFVELGSLGIILDAPLKEVPSERKIFLLRLAAKVVVRL